LPIDFAPSPEYGSSEAARERDPEIAVRGLGNRLHVARAGIRRQRDPRESSA
jgi:hypothetical protein